VLVEEFNGWNNVSFGPSLREKINRKPQPLPTAPCEITQDISLGASQSNQYSASQSFMLPNPTQDSDIPSTSLWQSSQGVRNKTSDVVLTSPSKRSHPASPSNRIIASVGLILHNYNQCVHKLATELAHT
jgi:hypothetical protein